VNDHIALRTFNLPKINRKSLGECFRSWGYQRVEDLPFPEKKLWATYYSHPDSSLPKVFISELILEEFPAELQDWIRDLCRPVEQIQKITPEFFLKSNWDPCSFEKYEKFYPMSEYAAWTAAFGVQVNHFTILFNELKTFQSLEELNSLLLSEGFSLNMSGGAIKGSPAELLEQSSTLARKIPWKFANYETKNIMGCYYEFARRYLIPGSTLLFQGFSAKSADKIFESTFEQKTK
jgi:hypothetical protein